MPRPCDPAELRCTRHLESLAWRQGRRFIAGCDEAGRGALLGPLYAAAVILDPAKSIPGIDDSKKLTARRREALAEEIRAKALAWQVVAITAEEVDALNVYEASRQGMLRALKALSPAPDFILTDAMPLRGAGGDFAFPTAPSFMATRVRFPLPPRRFWLRWRETSTWRNSTGCFRNTASPRTKVTARAIT